jgi:hypothetical protein
VALLRSLSRVIRLTAAIELADINQVPKESTMKYIQRAIAFSGLLVLLTFSSVLAQSDRQTIIHIPFNFSVGEKSFPAGKYVIARNRNNSDTVWVIRHKDDVSSAVLLTTPNLPGRRLLGAVHCHDRSRSPAGEP